MRTEVRLELPHFNASDQALGAEVGRQVNGAAFLKFRRAYVGGTFDLPHRGHITLLARVKRIAGEVVLGLNTDEFAEVYKRRPVMPLADRMAVWGQCRLVDHLVVNIGGRDSRLAIDHAGNVDAIVHGNDWTGDALCKQMGLDDAFLQTRGIALVYLPYTDWVSTTALRTRIGDPALATTIMRAESR